MKSSYIVNPDNREPNNRDLLLIVLIIIGVVVAICFQSCSTTKTIEKVNYRDSVVTKVVTDTTHIIVTDTNYVEYHAQTEDNSQLDIVFGQGGGTYNTKTGQATNVAGVKENRQIKEQRDSIALLSRQVDFYKSKCDSLTQNVSHYTSEKQEESIAPKRSGYDRFCSWWFWITALLLLVKLAAWVMEKIPVTAPYVMVARKFIPFL